MILVFCTTKDSEEAYNLANFLLDEKLIACANIVPNIRSLYFWKGSKEDTNEYLLIMKTVESKFPNLVKKIKEKHSYELPEIIAIPVSNADPEYVKWIEESLS
ncbi:MAG: divalent-cation tolerance protein CutA [Dictyoglomus sp. NZ13-RE01]|nr:MAG: divalent-cation tolerance protein CutA [Dictyoglomus sp. NZ13-RE01]